MKYEPKDKRQVAVFGAGIAGLTAAHELVERGFDVEVYECAEPSARDRLLGHSCAIGGMARTQWARVERGYTSGGSTNPLSLLLNEPEQPGGDIPRLKVFFKQDSFDFADDEAACKTLNEVAALLKAYSNVGRIEVRGFSRDRKRTGLGGPTDLDTQRAEAVALRDLKLKRDVAQKVDYWGAGLGYPNDWAKEDDARDYVSFHVVENWVPGEHGFRFFPSFYRNLFDTMRRTPVPDENEPIYQETPRTVLDNVVPTAFMALSTKITKEPFPFKRQPLKSLQELFDQLTGMLGAMGHSLDDMNRFHLKLFKYMTSCRARRSDYEKISWYDFLEGDQFSEEFRTYLESGGQTLVAMVASNCDARTYGSISAQMIENQIVGLQRTDGTLNGPTSIAWFDHWRRYLENQGVRFRRGELIGFEAVDSQTIWPKVKIYESQADEPPIAPQPCVPNDQMPSSPQPVTTIVVRDYYVLALPAEVLQDLAKRTPALRGDDFDLIRRFNLGNPAKPVTGGALEHMSGIQFYLPTDFNFIEGHALLPDTPWRLSAIFQPQFWTQKRGWWSGYRGVLSVDVSSWHQEGIDDEGNPIPTAWTCTRRQIADYTRMQIERGFRIVSSREPALSGIKFPAHLFYHIDDNILFEKQCTATCTDPICDENHWTPSRNLTPFLMSRPGEYGSRPGSPTGYTMHPGNIVLAGTLMQTRTRLTTMEAANESGRHAANAILANEGKRKNVPISEAEQIQIYDIEENEPEDLKLLVEVDEELHRRSLPHLVDILDLREAPCSLLRPDCDPSLVPPDPLGPLIDIGRSKT